MNIAICDDQTELINVIRKYVDEYFAENGRNYLVDEFNSGNALLNTNKKYDAVFLDI